MAARQMADCKELSKQSLPNPHATPVEPREETCPAQPSSALLLACTTLSEKAEQALRYLVSSSSLIRWGRVRQSNAPLPNMLLTFSVLGEEGGFHTGLPWNLVP